MTRRDIDGLLLDLSQPDGATDPHAIAEAWQSDLGDQLREEVVRHRLAAAALDALRRADAPVDPSSHAQVEEARRVRMLAMRALATIGEALDEASVPWVVFKGPAISRLMNRRELRTFNDLDLLVDPSSFGTAIEALIGAGVDEINRNWSPYVRHRVGEVPMEMHGITVDVHWHVTGLGRDRTMFRLDPTAMVRRRVARPIGDDDLPVFDPVDQLLHLSLHAALGGGKRLDQFRDVAVVAGGESIDWDELVRRARAMWIDGLVGHLLDRATRNGPADIDDGVVDALAGTGSLARRRRLDGQRIDGLRGLPVLLRRHRRRDVARVIGRRAVDRVTGPARGGWDFTDPRSRLYFDREVGGAEARRAFIDAVVRGEL